MTQEDWLWNFKKPLKSMQHSFVTHKLFRRFTIFYWCFDIAALEHFFCGGKHSNIKEEADRPTRTILVHRYIFLKKNIREKVNQTVFRSDMISHTSIVYIRRHTQFSYNSINRVSLFMCFRDRETCTISLLDALPITPSGNPSKAIGLDGNYHIMMVWKSNQPVPWTCWSSDLF